jgi:hypothetical protein
MSAITFEWTPTEVAVPIIVSVEASEIRCREKEFQDALERYIAGYVACQVDRTKLIESSVNSDGLAWLRALRRLRTATCEIWLFSREICGDWRRPRVGPGIR